MQVANKFDDLKLASDYLGSGPGSFCIERARKLICLCSVSCILSSGQIRMMLCTNRLLHIFRPLILSSPGEYIVDLKMMVIAFYGLFVNFLASIKIFPHFNKNLFSEKNYDNIISFKKNLLFFPLININSFLISTPSLFMVFSLIS